MRSSQVIFCIVIATVLTACAAPQPSPPGKLRVATFNIAMGLNQADTLAQRLQHNGDENLKKVAAIIQQVRPDILLLNEFDYQHDTDAAALLNQNYLSQAQFGQMPIIYPYAYSTTVNTGVDSQADLNNNGKLNEAADAFGFGRFPGQYGMLVLSKFPIEQNAVRSLHGFLWKDMPGALLPKQEDGQGWYSAAALDVFRLSSKSHWDIPINIDGQRLHFLVFHPTPPVFDGPEDRNGRRNHDEIRLFADYIADAEADYIYDQHGQRGGIGSNALFVLAGDLNADPFDGDSSAQAIQQLLKHANINATCTPQSRGAEQASAQQKGANLTHRGPAASDTSDFNDRNVGNLRLDYVLPQRSITINTCGVFWPATDETGANWITASDHRLVWIDISLP